MARMKRVGIIGCGTIGTGIAKFLQTQLKKKTKIVALCDTDPKKSKDLQKKIKFHPVVTSMKKLIKRSDLVIEAASTRVSAEIAKTAIQNKKDVLIMSTGGLLKRPSLLQEAKSKDCNLHIPSGAVCGLDGLRSASAGKIKEVTLTTRKPPKGLRGAPYLKRKGIDVDKIKKETIIFSGTAKEAVKHFPKNINVAATVSLSGLGPTKTRVRIITSPLYTKNSHELEVKGEFGRLVARTENVPSRQNPKTSQLAIFSALAKLKEVI